MAIDIILQLEELALSIPREQGRSTITGAAREIEWLRKENEFLKNNLTNSINRK